MLIKYEKPLKELEAHLANIYCINIQGFRIKDFSVTENFKSLKATRLKFSRKASGKSFNYKSTKT